jgi:hypothetical protein
MTTTVYVDFTPSLDVAFQFQPTLDNGVVYNVIITWNVYGQRWYINIYTLTNQRVLTRSMVGSPLDYNINLVAGYFTQTQIVYRIDNAQIEIISV